MTSTKSKANSAKPDTIDDDFCASIVIITIVCSTIVIFIVSITLCNIWRKCCPLNVTKTKSSPHIYLNLNKIKHIIDDSISRYSPSDSSSYTPIDLITTSLHQNKNRAVANYSSCR